MRYILDDPATFRCGTVWLHGWAICSRKLRFRHYYLWLFLQVTLSHTPPLLVLEVHINGIRGTHKRHQRYNYLYHRVQNSYQLFPMLMDTHIHIPYCPYGNGGLILDLNGIEGVIHLSFPENYSLDTIISDYFYRSHLTTRLNGR